MLTVEQVKNDISHYKIENGIVYDKSTNQPIHDEEKILEVKASVLAYREAKRLFNLRKRGEPEQKEEYIKRALSRYGLNGEVNTFGENKVIRSIIENNGNLKIGFLGDSLEDPKFSFMCEPKKEYGMAAINYIAHKKGIEIANLDISIDVSDFKKTGGSDVYIKYDKKQYISKEPEFNKDESKLYHHPKANELNELEKQKQLAKQNNDTVAYNFAQRNIESIIRNNPAYVSSSWDSMNIDEKISFVKVKINESKILHDEDEFKFWNSNLQSLMMRKNNKTQESEHHLPSYSSIPIHNEVPADNAYEEMLSELETKDYKYYFDEMIKAVNRYSFKQTLSEEEKKQIIGEIFYNEGYMIDSLSNDTEMRQLISSIVYELSNSEMQVRLSNIVLTEIQEKYRQLHPELERKQTNQDKKENTDSKKYDIDNNLDLSVLIRQLQNKLNQVQNQIKNMYQPSRNIDDEELASLLKMVEKIIDDGYSLKSLAIDQSDIKIISKIINTLEEQQKRIKKQLKGIEEYSQNSKKFL